MKMRLQKLLIDNQGIGQVVVMGLIVIFGIVATVGAATVIDPSMDTFVSNIQAKITSSATTLLGL